MNTRKYNYLNCRFFAWIFLFFPLVGFGAPYVANLEATPNGFFINNPTTVTFTVQVDISDSNLIASSASLIRYNQQNQVVGTPSKLFDDGSNGDMVAGDGIFSRQLTINENAPTAILFKASFAYKGLLRRVFSDFAQINVVTKLSEQDKETALNIPNMAINQYEEYISQGLSPFIAQNRTIDWLRLQPGVDEAGPSSDEVVDGIWVAYKSGILGSISLVPAGSKGSGTIASTNNSPPSFVVSKANAIVINTENEVTDTSIIPLLENSQLPIKATEIKPVAVSVDTFKSLSNYGTIIVNAHGNHFLNNLHKYQKRNGYLYSKTGLSVGDFIDEIAIDTGEPVTVLNMDKYNIDLETHTLTIFTDRITKRSRYGILPSFIKQYNKDFPNSIVFLSSCYSLLNDSMSSAFLGAGVKTVFGFNGKVGIPFSNEIGYNLFQNLTSVNESTGVIMATGEAFQPATDSFAGGSFVMHGNENTVLPNNLVANGSFETGGLKFWNSVGNYTAAVPSFATDGALGARIGRVDGPSVGINSIYQDIDIPMLNINQLPPGAKLNIWFNYKINYSRTKPLDFEKNFPSHFEANINIPSIDPFPVPGPIVTNSSFEGVANESIINTDVRIASQFSAFNTLAGVADVSRFMGNTIRLSFSLTHGGDPYERVTAYIDDVFFDVCSDQPNSQLGKCRQAAP